MIRKKILLLGDFAVGKTSLIKRYVDGTFDDVYLTTIGVKISKKTVTFHGVECELLIWDVEGSTPSKSISLKYYRGASGAIFVADVTRKKTIENLQEHKNIFLAENPDAHYVTAYNKADMLGELDKKRVASKEDVYLTSAKENENVEKLFIELVRKMTS